MAAVLLTPPYLQFFDDNGDPLSGGMVYTYEAGTTTPKATYTDASGLTPAANPVVLDSAGRATIWINGSYNIEVRDSDDVLVENTDNILAFSTASAGAGTFTTLNVTETSTGAIGNHMQCRLVIDGVNFRLQPYNGNIISISGINYIIPQAGVALAPSGLAATTLYYVYATWNGTAIALSPVTTGYIISGNGIPVRSDNSAQTLVGIIYLKTGASTTNALIRSWANRTNNVQEGTLGANATTTSTTPVVSNVSTRIEALLFSGETWMARVSGTISNSVAAAVNPGIFFDGTSAVNVAINITANNLNANYSVQDSNAPTEGYHYVDLGFATSTGTATLTTGNRVIGEIRS